MRTGMCDEDRSRTPEEQDQLPVAVLRLEVRVQLAVATPQEEVGVGEGSVSLPLLPQELVVLNAGAVPEQNEAKQAGDAHSVQSQHEARHKLHALMGATSLPTHDGRVGVHCAHTVTAGAVKGCESGADHHCQGGTHT
jgi:hypothetical protein